MATRPITLRTRPCHARPCPRHLLYPYPHCLPPSLFPNHTLLNLISFHSHPKLFQSFPRSLSIPTLTMPHPHCPSSSLSLSIFSLMLSPLIHTPSPAHQSSPRPLSIFIHPQHPALTALTTSTIQPDSPHIHTCFNLTPLPPSLHHPPMPCLLFHPLPTLTELSHSLHHRGFDGKC